MLYIHSGNNDFNCITITKCIQVCSAYKTGTKTKYCDNAKKIKNAT